MFYVLFGQWELKIGNGEVGRGMKKIVRDVVEEAEKLVKSIPGEAAKQIVGEKDEPSSERGGQPAGGSGAGQRQQKQRDDAYLKLAKADDRQRTGAEVSYLERELAELRRRKEAEKKQPSGDAVDEKKRKEEKKKAVAWQAEQQRQKEKTLWGVRKKRLKTERIRG